MRSWVAARYLVVSFVVAASIGMGTAPASAQQTCDGVWVVVDAREAGGGLTARCAAGDPSSGIRALEVAGHAYGYLPSQPGFVCTIDRYPAACNGGPADAHWSYWTAPTGGSWSYSGAGAAARDPEPGTVEGWRFGDGSAPPGMAPPAPAPEREAERGDEPADGPASDDRDEPGAAAEPEDGPTDAPTNDPTDEAAADPSDEPETRTPTAAPAPDDGDQRPSDGSADDVGDATPDRDITADRDRRDTERSRPAGSRAGPDPGADPGADTDADGGEAAAQDAGSTDSPGTTVAGSTTHDGTTDHVDALPATAAARRFPAGLLAAVLLIGVVVVATMVTARRRRSEDVG